MERFSRAARTVAAVSAMALVSFAAVAASYAHYPVDAGWAWTCSGGEPASAYQGNCFAHQSGSFASWHVGTGWTSSGITALRTAVNKWNHPNGHQYYVVESGGFAVDRVDFQICRLTSAVGCTYSSVNSAGHLVVSLVRIHVNATVALLTNANLDTQRIANAQPRIKVRRKLMTEGYEIVTRAPVETIRHG